MKKKTNLARKLLTVAAVTILALGICSYAAAHCDTLDGPVIKDARTALDKGDITPVLKWVQKKDEAQAQKAFKLALAGGKKGPKSKEHSAHRFFETLVKIHRAGEGAPFTGLKPAGEVEPVIVAADVALAGGSAEELVKLVTSTAAQGISERHSRAVELYKHKDESVEAGRKYVEAYIEYTHYVERLQQDAEGYASQHKEPAGKSVIKGHAH